MKYIVLKPFKYNMKNYVRGDEFDNNEINMPNTKIDVRIKAGIIIEESRLTSTDKAKIVRSRVNKPIDKPEVKIEPIDKPVEEPKEELVIEPKVETPTLFNNNVGGGKGKHRK